MKISKVGLCLVPMVLLASVQSLPAATIGNQASNNVVDGIAGTRHNLTQNFKGGGDASGAMSTKRNNYGEVCVYCHTPHGANTTSGAGMPLWNRTVDTSPTYELYDTPTTMGNAQNVTMAGPASLTCLSCHDGITAIDSIINMPGSGGYSPEIASVNNTAVLDKWNLVMGGNASDHDALNPVGCIECHNSSFFSAQSLHFENFVIGGAFVKDGSGFNNGNFKFDSNVVDLRDDHPVGVLYPTTFGEGVDFNPNTVEEVGRYRYIENGVTGVGNGRADKHEVRLYDSGEGYEVECASCHDPHGVPDASGSKFIPSFLRISNDGSTLCLTCHIK